MLPPLLNNQKGGRKHFYFHPPSHIGKRYFAKIEETNDN